MWNAALWPFAMKKQLQVVTLTFQKNYSRTLFSECSTKKLRLLVFPNKKSNTVSEMKVSMQLNPSYHFCSHFVLISALKWFFPRFCARFPNLNIAELLKYLFSRVLFIIKYPFQHGDVSPFFEDVIFKKLMWIFWIYPDWRLYRLKLTLTVLRLSKFIWISFMLLIFKKRLFCLHYGDYFELNYLPACYLTLVYSVSWLWTQKWLLVNAFLVSEGINQH